MLNKMSLILMLSLSISISHANENKDNAAKKSPINEMLKHHVPTIIVKGIGTVKVGDALIHKSIGRGIAIGLYKRNGIDWVAFEINGTITFVNLTAKYFKPL